MSGYPGGDIRHSMPTEMPSTGMSRYPASTEIQSALTFRHSAGMCGYSAPTGIQSAPIRRPVKPDSHRPSREARNRAPNAPQCALPLAAAGTVAGFARIQQRAKRQAVVLVRGAEAGRRSGLVWREKTTPSPGLGGLVPVREPSNQRGKLARWSSTPARLFRSWLLCANTRLRFSADPPRR